MPQTTRERELRARLEAAVAAARSATCASNDDVVWTRAAYEAASSASALDPAPDDEIVRTHPAGREVSLDASAVEDALAQRLAALRHAQLMKEVHDLDAAQLAAAERSAGGAGPYDRAAYERACAAAGQIPLPDGQAAALAAAHIGGGALSGGIPLAGGAARTTAQVRLAVRRLHGLQSETRARMCARCGTWTPPGWKTACPGCPTTGEREGGDA